MEKPFILIVDDDKASRDVTRLFLKDLCNADIAFDGATAVKKAGEKKYDAILMDIGLGREMNGLEATRQIKNIPGYQNVPIVAVTAYAMRGDKEEFLTAGCTHYLSKPFDSATIKTLIKEVLSI